MFVKDILPDLSKAVGTCTGDYAYRRITDAVKLLTQKGLVDPQIGEIAACVCGNFVTLPAEVKTPLGISVDGAPAIIRDQWFDYHINGPGDTAWTAFGFADVLGSSFCTIRDPAGPVNLVAKIHAASDQNKQVRVFGYAENGNRITTTGPDGPEDGFIVPTVFGSLLTNGNVPPIAKIERIYKEETADLVELFGSDPSTDEVTTLLGRYRPRERTPAYTRIRVPQQQVVRVKYKRRIFEVEDQYDWIPVDSREALIHAIRAVVYRLDGKYGTAREAETEAVRLMKEETSSNRPGGIKPPQTINNELPRQTAGSSMFYGGRHVLGNRY